MKRNESCLLNIMSRLEITRSHNIFWGLLTYSVGFASHTAFYSWPRFCFPEIAKSQRANKRPRALGETRDAIACQGDVASHFGIATQPEPSQS
jgi:hypothetical protein